MQAWLQQTGRFLNLTTPLAENKLLLHEFSAEDTLSNLFTLKLQMISADFSITAESLLHKPVGIQIHINNQSEPYYFHGIFDKFNAGAIKGGIRHYYGEAKPWLWFLNFASDCRSFQQKDTTEILKLIFQEFDFYDYDFSLLNTKLQKRNYCVQYQETTLNFIQRLLEEEGIFYFFEHSKDKHTLVLANESSTAKSCSPAEVTFSTGSNKNLSLTQWNRHYSFHTGNVSQTDYNFETPSASLHTKQQNISKIAASKKYELFYYPGKQQTASHGEQLTQKNTDLEQSKHDVVHGKSNCVFFSIGKKFILTEAPHKDDCGDYLLTSLQHHATDGSYLNIPSNNQTYHNSFTCIPINAVFRPIKKTKKPFIYSAQSAIVVGPASEEIHTDKYGRIKVQFHWDRHGKKDEYSSCWIRVIQSFSGNNWGTLFLPRIGQEVIVQFLEGDPDRPVIIGSVYNADYMPPYDLPFEQTKSGIKTCSTKNGNASEANELCFEDKLGEEEIYIHAKKDFHRVIENHEVALINHGDYKIIVKTGESIIESAKAITLKVKNSSIKLTPDGIFINGDKVFIN